MYIHFYGLEELPFNITPDSRFLYLSKRHKEALASLVYGVKERKGFISLTGEIGSGKTTICRAFLKEIDLEQNKVAVILNSFLTEIELLQAINGELGLPSQMVSKKELIDVLNKFLLDAHSKGHNVILILDEAQNLMPPVLEQIRMLSNLETETDKLLQIILIGQPELDTILNLAELEQLNQRIGVKYHITALTPNEVEEYIQHRLKVAGAKVKIEFTQNALKTIFNESQGIPRKINLLCDRILLIGYVEGKTNFDEEVVEKAVGEIKGGLQNRFETSGREIKKFGRFLTSPPSHSKFNLASISMLFFIFLGIIFISTSIGYILANYQRASFPGAIYEKLVRKQISGENKGGQDSSKILGNREKNFVGEQTVQKTPQSLISQSEAFSNQKPVTTPIPLSSPPSTPIPLPIITPAPAPTLAPKPKEKILYNWQYDNNGIVRISSPDLTYQACILSWLYLWNIEVDLSDFKKYSEDTIKRFDLAVQNEKLGLRKYEIDWKLNSAMVFDLPIMVKLKENNLDLSQWVLLKRLEGKSCTIIDPINGLTIKTKKQIEDLIEKIVILYFDPNNFASIVRGEESERVKKIQEILFNKGFLKDEPSGVFDRNTYRAIINLQKFYNFQETGNLTTETVIILSGLSSKNRPHLYSGFGVE